MKELKTGTKCTVHFFGDSKACQIVAISEDEKTIWLRRNLVTVKETSSKEEGHQDWEIHENEFLKVMTNFNTMENYREPILIDEPDEYSYFEATLRPDRTWRTVKSNSLVRIGKWFEFYNWQKWNNFYRWYLNQR